MIVVHIEISFKVLILIFGTLCIISIYSSLNYCNHFKISLKRQIILHAFGLLVHAWKLKDLLAVQS